MRICSMTRYIVWIAVTVVGLAGCNFTQSPLTCDIGQGGGDPSGWFAKYTLKPGQPTGACSQKLGEGLGVRKYFQPLAGDPNKGPDPKKQSVVIGTDTLGNLALGTPSDPNPAHSPNSSV